MRLHLPAVCLMACGPCQTDCMAAHQGHPVSHMINSASVGSRCPVMLCMPCCAGSNRSNQLVCWPAPGMLCNASAALAATDPTHSPAPSLAVQQHTQGSSSGPTKAPWHQEQACKVVTMYRAVCNHADSMRQHALPHAPPRAAEPAEHTLGASPGCSGLALHSRVPATLLPRAGHNPIGQYVRPHHNKAGMRSKQPM